MAKSRKELDFVWKVINPISLIHIEAGIVTIKN